jgi:hypothetical protein
LSTHRAKYGIVRSARRIRTRKGLSKIMTCRGHGTTVRGLHMSMQGSRSIASTCGHGLEAVAEPNSHRFGQ